MSQIGGGDVLWAFQILEWNRPALSSAQEQALSPKDDITLAPVTGGGKREYSFPRCLIQKSFKGGKEHHLFSPTLEPEK